MYKCTYIHYFMIPKINRIYYKWILRFIFPMSMSIYRTQTKHCYQSFMFSILLPKSVFNHITYKYKVLIFVKIKKKMERKTYFWKLRNFITKWKVLLLRKIQEIEFVFFRLCKIITTKIKCQSINGFDKFSIRIHA